MCIMWKESDYVHAMISDDADWYANEVWWIWFAYKKQPIWALLDLAQWRVWTIFVEIVSEYFIKK